MQIIDLAISLSALPGPYPEIVDVTVAIQHGCRPWADRGNPASAPCDGAHRRPHAGAGIRPPAIRHLPVPLTCRSAPARHNVDALALHATLDADHAGAEQDTATFLEDFRPDNGIGDPLGYVERAPDPTDWCIRYAWNSSLLPSWKRLNRKFRMSMAGVVPVARSASRLPAAGPQVRP